VKRGLEPLPIAVGNYGSFLAMRRAATEIAMVDDQNPRQMMPLT
jgi:hypothetical protein